MKTIISFVGFIAFVVVMNTSFTPQANKSIIGCIDFSVGEVQASIAAGNFCVNPFGWGITHGYRCDPCEPIDWFWIWTEESRCTPS